jgi:hypothetical protein
MPINEKLIEQELNFLIANAMSNSLTLGLSDGLGAGVIHTYSSIPRKLKLSITNTLPVEVQIVGQPGPASPSNYHFHIQFVNNQCFLSSPPLKLSTPEWASPAVVSNGEDFITDIYLLSTATISLGSSSLPGSAGQTTEVELLYTEAQLNNVAVEVLQVTVTVCQNVFALINSNPQPIMEAETVHLTTFADAGAPSPLIATLVQPRTILNDGSTESQLLLRLVNTSPDPVTFAPPPADGSPTPTAVQLSVDLNEAAAWALCKSDEAGPIVVAHPANWIGDSTGVVGTGRKTWLFRPDYSLITQIAPNSALEFPISNVRTTLPPGFTNLYVTLQEFPNYGTQTAVAQIEKSPLIYNGDIGSGLLSCGTTGSKQGLTLNGNTTDNGNITADLLLVNQTGGGKSAHFKGGAGVSIENNLDVTGNVGIGTDQPKSTLSVKGGAAVGATYANSVAAPNELIVEGSIGIGTPSPKQKLDVAGNIKMSGTRTKLFYRGDNDSHVGSLAFYSPDGGQTAIITPYDGVGDELFKSTVSLGGFGQLNLDKVSLAVSGNVGIGTNKPVAPLDVKQRDRTGTHPTSLTGLYVTGDFSGDSNGVEFRHSNGTQGIGFGYNTIYATGSDADQPLSIKSRGAGNLLLQPTQGSVGIGTPSPKQKLDVAGNIKMSGQRTKLFYRGDSDSHVGSLALYSPDGGKTAIITPYDSAGNELPNSTVRLGGFGNFDTDKVSLAVSGRVGIGTTTPTKAALDVRTNAYPVEITANFGLVNGEGCWLYPKNMPDKRAISIYAESVLWCNNWVIASSDERIKRVQGLSDGAEDLNKLLSIEVTDYSYIDALSNGTDTHKKVIAQQVLKVFPQAVSEATNVVPDIYQKATIRDGWVQLATNLKKGERVRLIGEKNEGIHEVLEVTDGQFRTDFATEGQQVFVYGREVDDFLNVDYDAIAMLNVSATQQIKREKDAEVQALREENDALRARLDRLENLIERLASPGAFPGSDDSEENALVKSLI